MKKKIAKIVTITLVLLFTFATGVSADALYERWAGEGKYEQIKTNLTSFEASYDNLFVTKEQLVQDKVDIQNKLTETKGLLATAESNNATITTERNSLSAQVDGLNRKVTDLEKSLATANSKIKNTDRLYGEVKNQLTNLIAEVNKSNGKGNRYDILAVKVNELAGYVGVKGGIDNNVGGGVKSKELKQAEQDITDLEEKSDALLEKIKDKK